MVEVGTKKGTETLACGCFLDHDAETVSPCEGHMAEILAKMAEDNDGKITFAKKD